MRLVVTGAPHISSPTCAACQTTVVRYDPARELTLINCDVDIVTLGITVNVLQKMYTEYLSKLDPCVAQQIHDTTSEAVNTDG